MIRTICIFWTLCAMLVIASNIVFNEPDVITRYVYIKGEPPPPEVIVKKEIVYRNKVTEVKEPSQWPKEKLSPDSRSRVMSLVGELEDRRRMFLRGESDLDSLANSDLSRIERSKSLYQSLLVEFGGDEGKLAGLLLAVEERYIKRINRWHKGITPAPGCCGDDFDAVVYDLLLRKS